mgnify:CR=1 FL=1
MSTAAFLEDQDFFRFFWEFSETLPCVRFLRSIWRMLWFRPELYKDNASGKLSVNLKVSAPENRKINARFVLKDQEAVLCWKNLLTLQEKKRNLH